MRFRNKLNWGWFTLPWDDILTIKLWQEAESDAFAAEVTTRISDDYLLIPWTPDFDECIPESIGLLRGTKEF